MATEGAAAGKGAGSGVEQGRARQLHVAACGGSRRDAPASPGQSHGEGSGTRTSRRPAVADGATPPRLPGRATEKALAPASPGQSHGVFAEQFMNEKLVVDVLRIGVPVGVKDAAQWGVETEDVVATREDVERAVAAVMDGGQEGAARRARAAELGRKARDAVALGGSSDRNVALLMEHVEQMKPTV